MQPRSISLDPSLRSFDVSEIENKLKGRIAGQDEAVSKFCGLLETFFAGYGDTNAPVGVILEMGPTGTGKTSLIENLCEILFSNPKAFVRINCADFGDSHQVNRMVGAPPGYVGYKDKKLETYLSQERLNAFHTPDLKFNIVLLDEIEKAATTFYQFLLAIFNDGEGRINGELVDFRHTLFVMTSNLGARNLSKSIGFSKSELSNVNKHNCSAATDALEQHFEPEFINRIDEVIHFEALSKEKLDRIFDIQIGMIRHRFLAGSKTNPQFVFRILDKAREEMVRLGFNTRYGARPLKRVLKRVLVDKLASMVRTGQIEHGDLAIIDFNGTEFNYSKYNGDDVGRLTDAQWRDFQSVIG